MSKTVLTFGVITILILIAGVFLLTRNDSTTSTPGETTLPESHQYFWSKTCPHCTKVNEFMQTWKGKDEFEMEKIDVNESKENTVLFLDKGTKICKKPASKLGVPLLITPEGRCLSGDVSIIEYLKGVI